MRTASNKRRSRRKILKEYVKRTRKQLETKLHSRNLIQGINILAVLLINHRTILKVVERTSTNFQRKRKLMAMHKALHPRDDVDKPYLVEKRRRKKKRYLHYWECRFIDARSRTLYKKAWKTDLSHQKQYT